MRAACLASFCVLLIAGCGGHARDGAAGRTQTSGTLTAQFIPVPDPPRVGHDSSFAVTLTENGQPAAGARINLAFFYRSLNQTGPTATCTETAPGRYEASEVSTGMNGRWEAEAVISRANQPDVKLTFPFSVAK
jgi:hypothetical protein